jgi:multidrug efflux pump subunit AcrB
MPKEAYPEANLPRVFINTLYFGNSASEIEDLITRPIEKEIASITGINDLTSNSIQDFSVIMIEFNPDIEQDQALQKIKDAVDKAKGELPNDLEQDPEVIEVEVSEFPIMSVNLSGNYSMDELRNNAEYIQDRIESLREVSKVNIKGALDREVKIDIDLPKMQARKISFRDIEQAIAQENLSMSAGEMISGEFRRSIRVIGQFEDVAEIEGMIIKSEEERPIYLNDFATVTYGFEDRTSYARSDGNPVISLDVVKRSGENIIDCAEKIKSLLEEEKAFLPPDMKVSIFNDLSINTKNDIKTLENSIISGIILVILVLLLFLGLKNALFVGVAIPLSMLMGILFLHLTGNTLNMMVLFALILALGLLVDNAIVVVENIYRYMQENFSRVEAAKYGTAEVATPIIVSTATTLAAFIPLASWPGIMGEFMKYLPITLIIVLTSSLFVALVFNPVFTSRFMKIDTQASKSAVRRRRVKNIMIGSLIYILIGVSAHMGGIEWLRNLSGIVAGVNLVNFFILRPFAFYFQSHILPLMEKSYSYFVRLVLKGYIPGLVFFGTFALLGITGFLLAKNSPKIELFAEGEPIYINVFLDLPLGSDIEATNRVALEIEKRVEKVISSRRGIVNEVLAQIGEATDDPRGIPEPGLTPHKARITISFVPYEDRNGTSTATILEDIRNATEGIPGVRMKIAKDLSGPPIGLPVNLEIVGDKMEVLAKLSEEILVFLNSQQVPGIEELRSDVQLAKPELEININREAARRYGISTAQIADAIRTSVYGKEVSKFKVGEDEYPIMIRLAPKYRYNVTDLMNQTITFRDQARRGQIVQVPISSVASYNYKTTYNAIKRKDQNRIITISSDILEGYNGNEIVSELERAMAQFSMPQGYSYKFTGEQEDQMENTTFLNSAFMVVIFTIFIILVAQFNSIYTPFIIILSVLFSTIGVLIGYLFTGEPIIIIFTGIGIISLAGIVVNNAIVLIDYINILIKRKRENRQLQSIWHLSTDEIKNAIIRGGETRLRPVLLTAITTVLGLLPMAIGFNFNFSTLITSLDPQIYFGGDSAAMWGPLARTVIYGLVFATFLTLIVVPVMYWIAYWIKRLIEGRRYLKFAENTPNATK